MLKVLPDISLPDVDNLSCLIAILELTLMAAKVGKESRLLW